MDILWSRFWEWYQQHERLNLAVSWLLLMLQIVHLTWLAVDVALPRVLGTSPINLATSAKTLLALVDYTEFPALFGASLLYMNAIRRDRSDRTSAIYLLLIASQILHILWITDEFVVTQFGDPQLNFPPMLAWLAIAIDYFEVPVIFDTTRKILGGIKNSS